MNCAIRQVTAADVDAVTRLEAKCFPPHEAPGREVFARRIAAFGDSFFVAEAENYGDCYGGNPPRAGAERKGLAFLICLISKKI